MVAGEGEKCPWGFSCKEVTTVDGASLSQCVNDAGVCPCTETSVALGLWTPCRNENEYGLCEGQRFCDEEGLSGCDALLPAMEACNGVDDNCDGDVDEPLLVEGNFINLCDDDNDCTEDKCLGEEGCANEVLETGDCNDGDPCTVADHCESGACVGQPVECEDNDPCTDNVCTDTGGCSFEPNTGPCDDGNACTVADQCTETGCVGTKLPCDCQVDEECAGLEDGDVCNGTLVCSTGSLPYKCEVDIATIIECEPPGEGPDAVCQQAFCVPETGECQVIPDNEGFACDDGDACSAGDKCADGSCTPGIQINCADDNPCTDDSCDTVVGCLQEPNAAPCSDGNTCTLNDTCADGACGAGVELDCNDNHPCTVDSCDPAAGCVHEPSDGPCDDGNACTEGDHCEGGACVFDGQQVCSDGDVCTDDGCDPVQGCVFTLNQAPCDDGDICTLSDHCHLGSCISSSELTCNDGNMCTDDSCHPVSGCVFAAGEAACDDGNACTENDQCAGGWCVGGAPPMCDDANACTDDSCDPAKGCVNSPNTAPCEDGDVCTQSDVCAGSQCVPGPANPCDDGNVCTDDSCDPTEGCQHVDNTASCPDQDECTVNEICQNGECGWVEKVCDDLDPCTTDGCDSDTGCTTTALPNETPCGEGFWCVEAVCTEKPEQEVVIDTHNFNGMTGYPLKFDDTPYCSPTTCQQQMDALCQLAGFAQATEWTYESKYINNCYCWGSCSNYQWQSNCCSGWQTQVMVTSVTCEK